MERQCTLAKNDDVHVQRFEMCWTIRILVEGPETNKVIVSEKFNLFPSFLHEDIFSCERMDIKNLGVRRSE